MFFGVNSNQFLKFIYNALLTGMPSLMNNPINKNILHAPFTVNKYSTYINYKLDEEKIIRINEFLENKNNGLSLSTTKLLENSNEDYYLSINIYNCSSPLFDFLGTSTATRCEVNVYVKDENNEESTLIIDYESNILSLDPENLFKKSSNIVFNEDYDFINGEIYSKNFMLDFYYNKNNYYSSKLDEKLIKLSDKIYYTNGYYDKLYYDSSLIHNKIKKIKELDFDINFKFLGLEFNNINSVFYFENKINFVGGLWHNIYD